MAVGPTLNASRLPPLPPGFRSWEHSRLHAAKSGDTGALVRVEVGLCHRVVEQGPAPRRAVPCRAVAVGRRAGKRGVNAWRGVGCMKCIHGVPSHFSACPYLVPPHLHPPVPPVPLRHAPVPPVPVVLVVFMPPHVRVPMTAG